MPGEEDRFAVTESGTDVIGRLRLLWADRKLLYRCLLAGLVVGCLIAFLIPAEYESTVQLMPPDTQSNAGLAMMAAMTSKGGNGMGAIAGDLLGIKSSGALFVGVLKSRTIQDRIVERFQLQKVYSTKLEEDARTKLSDRTGVSEDRKSGIVSIIVTDHDPNRAAGIAQAYADQLNQLMAELSTSAAHRERVFLESRLQEVKKDLSDASVRFGQFASKNTAIDIKEQGRAMVEAAAVLQGQLIAAESTLRGLEEIYTPNNVRVRSMQARIEELKNQLAKLGRGNASANQQSKSSDTQNSSENLYPSIRELPLLGVTYADLYRETKIQETVFETLTQQYELAKVQEAKEILSVKVLDSARVPQKKSFPPRMLIIGCAGMTFLAVAIGGVISRAKWDEWDDSDPGKAFAEEVWQGIRQKVARMARKESGSLLTRVSKPSRSDDSEDDIFRSKQL